MKQWIVSHKTIVINFIIIGLILSLFGFIFIPRKHIMKVERTEWETTTELWQYIQCSGRCSNKSSIPDDAFSVKKHTKTVHHTNGKTHWNTYRYYWTYEYNDWRKSSDTLTRVGEDFNPLPPDSPYPISIENPKIGDIKNWSNYYKIPSNWI